MLAGAPELHQMTWFGFGKVSLQFLQAQILIPYSKRGHVQSQLEGLWRE